jgi:hypothetical protein
MKTYLVKVKDISYPIYRVEAESPEDARISWWDNGNLIRTDYESDITDCEIVNISEELKK